MLWSLIGSIGGKVLDIVDDVVEDKEAANRLKLEIQRLSHTITETGFISCFAEPQEAVECLTYKRGRL